MVTDTQVILLILYVLGCVPQLQLVCCYQCLSGSSPSVNAHVRVPAGNGDPMPPPPVVPQPTQPASPSFLSRRDAITSGASKMLAFVATAASVVVPTPSCAEAGSVEGSPERQALLRAIASMAPDEEVIRLISKLEPLDPSRSKAATAAELGGTWELVYSLNASAFSPLLNLPRPIRPTSLQLIGDDAAREVGGQGRIVQKLAFPFLSLVLSSGIVPVASGNVLEIQPPFRLEVVWSDDTLRRPGRLAKGLARGGARWKLVDSGSDADFRALNARDEEAQAAGRNMYEISYLDTTGQAGDVRISRVVAGDPVIVGALFIHKRL